MDAAPPVYRLSAFIERGDVHACRDLVCVVLSVPVILMMMMTMTMTKMTMTMTTTMMMMMMCASVV